MKLRRKKHGLQESGIPYVLPALLVVASVMLFPLLYNIVLSFFKKTIYDMNWSFVGLAQYKKLLTSDTFLNALKNTVIWTVVSVFFQFLIGFICALVISQDRIRFRGIWRCLIMLAWVLPSVIGSMVWKWMYHSDFGILNEILLRLGLIKQALAWTGSKQLALTSAIIVNVWKLFPLVLMYIEAALQSVPRSLEDAAVVDGANTWTLNAFTFIYVLTGGGPGTASQVLSMFINKEAFQNYNFGVASAASTILFVIVAAFSTIYIRSTMGGGDE